MSICKLCSPFITRSRQGSISKRCINSDCDQKYFSIHNDKIVDYYLNFLRLTLTEQKFRTILSKKFSSRFSRNQQYQLAWEYFIEEVINNQNVNDISRVGVYYTSGTGVRKSPMISDLFFTLAEKYRPTISIYEESGDLCPVCTVNQDNGPRSEICCTCLNMVCGFCSKRLPSKKCPSCGQEQPKTVSEKIKTIRENIGTRKGRNIENAKVFLGWLILKSSSESDDQVFSLVSESIFKHCDKGYLLLATLYLTGKGCEKNTQTGVKILEKGVQRGNIECMIKLAKMYHDGDGVEKNKHKSVDFYKLAAINGNGDAFLYLHRNKL